MVQTAPLSSRMSWHMRVRLFSKDAAFCAEAFWTSQARVGAAAEAAISVLLRRSTEEI